MMSRAISPLATGRKDACTHNPYGLALLPAVSLAQSLVPAAAGQPIEPAPPCEHAPTRRLRVAEFHVSVVALSRPHEGCCGRDQRAPTGGPNHCTDFEHDPWWQVEFDHVIEVREVRVFNRVDALRNDFRNFSIMTSLDGLAWDVSFAKQDNITFDGVDGRIFIWSPDAPYATRFVRIRGAGFSRIDLDQVEIY
jgi:hypothetical protein